MTTPRTIAIGDIHGCAKALDALLRAIAPTADDKIVTLGDYVDRGPDSCGVIERLMELEGQCKLTTLLGNHEVMMLDALDRGGESLRFWLDCGGRDTLESYGGRLDDIAAEHIEWLRKLERHHETPRHIFVHANYDPNDDMADQPDYLTLWEHISYHPPVTEGLRGNRRGGLSEPVVRPGPHHSGKTVFVGHTPQRSGDVLDLDHVVCIDTGCAYGGWLTAIDVDSRKIWQADRGGILR